MIEAVRTVEYRSLEEVGEYMEMISGL